MGIVSKHIRAAIGAYSSVAFSSSVAVGVLLFFATFLNPNVAAAGLIAMVAAFAFARLINFDAAHPASSAAVFNPLLAGMAVGYVFRISPSSAILMAIAGALAFTITILLIGSLSVYLKLPALSLPFALAGCAMYIAAAKYPGFDPRGFYPGWERSLEPALPFWLEGFFKSCGMIFFMPHVIPGMIVAAAVLFNSRILFIAGAMGYFVGAGATGLIEHSYSEAFANVYNFNFIVLAMAIGCVFSIPSMTSYFLAAAAVCVAAVVQKALTVSLGHFDLPVLALPFNIVALLFLSAIGSGRFKYATRHFMPTPEETLDYYLTVSRRFNKSSERTLALPFSGAWTVWQGFDGEWTHKANQRYSYDFVIAGEHGRNHEGTGERAEDYYAFNKSALSPVSGYVAKVVSALPDNPIGQVDKANTWGNYVSIRDERGFYVSVCHLMRDSITVFEGAWVTKGAFIGKCGNSGYSPQPHIHIQAQKTIDLAAETLPYTFTSYATNNEFISNGLPETGTIVAPLFEDKSIARKTSYMIGDRFKFEVLKKGVRSGFLSLVVRSADDGTFYFDSGAGALYFGKMDGAFYAYRTVGKDKLLKAMFLALPSMPLGWKSGLAWRDFVSADSAFSWLGSGVLMLLSSFFHDFGKIGSELRFADQDTIEGRVSAGFLGIEKKVKVVLDEQVGIKYIVVDDIELRRIDCESVRG